MASGADLSTSRSTPVVDFTSADFDALKTDMRSYAQASFASDRWSDFNESQPGVMMLDLVAYLGDKLTYMINSHCRELFAGTVLRRQNLAKIGKPYNYEPKSPESATVSMRLTLDGGGSYPFTLLRATHQASNDADGDQQVLFQPVADTVVSSYPGSGYVDVDFVEGEVYDNQLIGVSGGQPAQRWQFPQQSAVKSSISVTVGGMSWTAITNWTTQASTDKVYKILQTDDGNTFIVFGDGIFGAIPASAAEIRATFRVGGGRRGNLNASTITRSLSMPAQVLSVTNPLASSEGDNAASMKVAREAVPGLVSTQGRAVTAVDYQQLAVSISGVAKARAAPAQPVGSNRVNLWIAPSGGGVPTSTLKNATSSFMKTKRMTGRRISLAGPVYKSVRLQVLLHINDNFRASDVNQAARNGLINTNGTGLFNFNQMDFGGVAKSSDGNQELLLGQTRLQGYFDDLQQAGLDRAEVLQLDVEPVARVRDGGNSGDGTVASVTLTGRQRRRAFRIELVSSAQYRVYERIVGTAYALTDTELVDDEKDFSLEGVSDYSGYRLRPNRDADSSVHVGSAAGQTITVSGLSGASLFTLTEVGVRYYMYNPTVAHVDVGTEFTSADGNVRFTVSAGAAPFIAGDAFLLDVFPYIGDVRLRDDEYPQLSEADFVTRTSGGSRV